MRPFRTKIAFAAAVLLLSAFFMAPACNAAPAADARRTLESAINSIMASLRNPAYANPATRDPLRQQIEKDVRGIFDFGEFSARTVGPRWKTFTPQEKQEFSSAFANLLFNTYLNRITGYHGETVAYTGETVSQDGSKVEVKTVISTKDGKKTPVSYRMLLKDGNWRVYDVIIENISLVKNYRTQFQDILNTATPRQLIDRVSAKAQEVIAQGNAQK